MYIFKYINTNDNSLIGYHLSSFCQIGPKEKAKRYTCPNGPESQMKVIRENLDYTLTVKDDDKGFFSSLLINVKNTYFKGLLPKDVAIEAEYLIDGITSDDIQHTIHTIVNNGEVHKTNIPLENIGEVIKEIHQSKNN